MTDPQLRIVHVSATFPPYYGGTGTVCYHNARVLAARGHEVHVYTSAWPGQPDDPPGVIVHRLRPLVRVGNAPVLPQLVRLPGDAIVHLHFPFYAGAEFVALARRPYVVTYHQDVALAGWMGRLTTAHDRLIGRQVLRRANRLCPTSLDYFQSSTFADLIPAMGDRLIPIPNGVDPHVFRPEAPDPEMRRRYGVPPEMPLALFVGSMDQAHYFKGIPTFLQALAGLPGVAALLVGEGDLRPDYERLAGELGLAQRVRFAGRVDGQELPVLYRAADVLVLPSETRGEAFGVVLLEAMASGRPVIASDLPGVRGVVTHEVDGLLVPPGNAEALQASLARMTTLDAAVRSTMGAAGRRKVEAQYSWERIGDRLEQMYRTVLSERRGNGHAVHPSPTPVLFSEPASLTPLPMEMHLAIDVVARASGGTRGKLQGHTLGMPRLVEELVRYAPVDHESTRLIVLAAEATELHAVVSARKPHEVVTLVAGPLARPLAPFRSRGGSPRLLPDLSKATWRALGYERVATTGIQGLSSVAWAVGERVMRRQQRPDLADRCRIAMLRTLITAQPAALGTIRVRRYRKRIT